MIISILGMSGKDREGKTTKANYFVSEELEGLVKNDSYINSSHALISCNKKEKFCFLGTKKSINYQKELIDFDSLDCEFLEYGDDISEIFNIVFSSIEESDEKIVFDITHSFRDVVIMSVITTIINQFLNLKKIDIVFAKEIEQYKTYMYIKVNEFLDISTLSFLLTTFEQTLNVPDINLNSNLYKSMKSFSHALMANQVNKLLSCYEGLKEELNTLKQSNLLVVSSLIDKILDEISVFDGIKDEPYFKQYFFIGKILFEKNYHLLALTYLFEAIPAYLFYYSKKLGVIEDEELSYDRGKELIKHLNKSKDKGLKQLRNFYHKLRVLRNDLAHINIKNHKDTFNALQKSFEKFENLVIKEDVFLQKIKKA